MTTFLRCLVGRMLISTGMAIIPSDVKEAMRGMMMYHVPGALTENEKASVRRGVSGLRLQKSGVKEGQS